MDQTNLPFLFLKYFSKKLCYTSGMWSKRCTVLSDKTTSSNKNIFFRKLLSWTHMQLNLSLQWDQRKWHWLLSYQAFISHWHWMVWTFKGNLILPNGNWKIDYTKDCQLESRCAVRWRPHPSLFKLPLLLQLTFSLVPLNPTRQKILSHPIAC